VIDRLKGLGKTFPMIAYPPLQGCEGFKILKYIRAQIKNLEKTFEWDILQFVPLLKSSAFFIKSVRMFLSIALSNPESATWTWQIVDPFGD